MSTLRESAEKLVNEAFVCEDTGWCHDIVHSPACPAHYTKAALSAVLKGMQLVLQGTPHLVEFNGWPVFGGSNKDDSAHEEDYCARFGGACRLREID